ncbi:hypothetical protein B0H10DRAFT_2209798 [Mycena sp. CBHHK59/15]|nr:hypothetical protein B0H10DRAFT_2209798 [Mycena sp. CBHHK59/15]
MVPISKTFVSLTFALASLGMPTAPKQARTMGTVFQIVPGLGACRWTNTSAQAVSAVSATTFKNYPGVTPNPNKTNHCPRNPICHRFLEITDSANGITVRGQIVDFFEEDPNAKANGVGIPAMQLQKVAGLDDGIIENAIWFIV